MRALFAGEDHAAQDGVINHDHTNPALHRGLSSPNVDVLGWTPLSTEYHGAPSGGYYCGEVSLGERQIAVVNSFTSDVAIVIVDVTDPAAPVMLGELVLPNTHIYDSAISDDGRYAILATSPLDVLFPEPGRASLAGIGPVFEEPEVPDGGPSHSITPVWRDACGNEYQGPEDLVPYASGVLLVDLSDPTVPSVADFVPQPAIGPHSVSATTIDGTSWVLASTTNLVYTASFFSFFTIEDTPLGGKLVPHSEFSANYENQVAGTGTDVHPLLNGHVDGTIQKHEPTGDTLAYLANWDGGLIVVRIDGPGQLTRLATWGERDPAAGQGMTGAIHTAYPVGMWHGNHVVITGQELGARPDGRPTGQIVILNTTDPANPQPLARWTLPVNIEWSGGLIFSTHYVALVDDTLYTALYHGGVWAADASPEQWPELPSIGVFIPDSQPDAPAATGGPTPEVLDVLALADGSVVAFDSTTGAYTFRIQPGALPLAQPWTDDAWIGLD